MGTQVREDLLLRKERHDVPARDVTDNRNRPEPLCADSACRALLDALPAAVVAADSSGTIVYANVSVTSLIGWKPDDLAGCPFTVLIPDRYREAYEERFRRRLAERKGRIPQRPLRFTARRPNGKELDLEVQFARLKAGRGRRLVVATLRKPAAPSAAADRTRRFLTEAGALLTSSLDWATTLKRIAALAVPRMGDWCSVDVLEDSRIRNLAVAHMDPEKVALARQLMERFPPLPDAPGGLAKVLRTGKPDLVPEIKDDMLSAAAVSADHLAILRQLRLKSFMCVPLVARSRVLGAITFVSTGRLYDANDLGLAEDLCRRAAIAVDNARLFQEAQTEIAERTNAQKAQSELMQQVQRHRKRTDDLLASVPGVVWESWGRPGEAGHMTDFVSNYAVEMLGYSLREWIAESGFWLRIVHSADRERVAGQVAAMYDSGEGGVLEFRWVGRDGRAVWVEAHFVVVKDESGAPTGIRGVAMDITDRKQTQELQSLLAAIVESSTDAVIGKSLEGVVVSWNSGAERMFGYTAEEMIGQPITMLYPRERIQEFAGIMERVRKGDHIRHYETVRVRKDGGRLNISVSISPIRNEDGEIVGAATIARDITESKRAEAALIRNQAHIAALNQRLQRAMTETHHRVKNNLQIIAAMVDMQVMDSADTVPVEELKRLGMHIHMLAVVHDLLTQEAKSDNQAQFISADAVLDRLLPMLQQMAGDTVIESHIQDARLSSKQGTSLAIVVNELVSNSIKQGAEHVLVELSLADGHARLSVTDDGPGFPAKFDPGHDSGIGLELVQNLTRWDLGGEAQYESVPGGGARVVITMPVPTGDVDPLYPPLLEDLRPTSDALVERSLR